MSSKNFDDDDKNNIVTNFNYKTYSLFNVDQAVFRINHVTGKTDFFNQGVWVPVMDMETLQKMAIERQQFEERMRRDAEKNQLLEQYD
jgi:hypothetical protein